MLRSASPRGARRRSPSVLEHAQEHLAHAFAVAEDSASSASWRLAVMSWAKKISGCLRRGR
jgi:hypothetical protein